MAEGTISSRFGLEAHPTAAGAVSFPRLGPHRQQLRYLVKTHITAVWRIQVMKLLYSFFVSALAVFVFVLFTADCPF